MSTAVLLCGTVLAAGSSCRRGTTDSTFGGTWVMSVDGRVLMVLMLEPRGEDFAGIFSHPQKMQTDGRTFTGLGGGIVTEHVVSNARQGSTLRLLAENPNNKDDKSEFEIALKGPNDLAVKLAGAPFEPWHFKRHDSEPKVATDWDPSRTYTVLDQSVPPSAEMAAIFEQDQAARQSPNLSAAQWKAIGQEDSARRVRTRTLLERGELRAAEDFRKAAFVFQHGSAPDDYLLAHSLALVALAKGDRRAAWIAAATLDRYLQSVAKPQIYGTQFSVGGGLKEPYDRKLIADSLRRSLGVPTLAEQEEQSRKSSAGGNADASK
jgi:hypothetical protein